MKALRDYFIRHKYELAMYAMLGIQGDRHLFYAGQSV